MASSENLASIEPWILRSSIADPWISEALARDTETLTKALQKSLSDHSRHTTSAADDSTVSPFLNLIKPDATAAVSHAPSNSTSGSRNTASTNHLNPIPFKRTKRKPRPSKRSSRTTFIAADPANFRRMVQEVTGGGKAQLPQQQRPVNQMMQWCLPTLDTSAAFLLDHYQQVLHPTAAAAAAAAPGLVADCGTGLDLDSLPTTFPTLESWKVT